MQRGAAVGFDIYLGGEPIFHDFLDQAPAGAQQAVRAAISAKLPAGPLPPSNGSMGPVRPRPVRADAARGTPGAAELPGARPRRPAALAQPAELLGERAALKPPRAGGSLPAPAPAAAAAAAAGRR